MPKTKKSKSTKNRPLTHPGDLIIPIKNVFYDVPLILFKLLGEPLLMVGLDITEKVGKETVLNTYEYSKLLIHDSIWGTDELTERLLSHSPPTHSKTKKGKKGKKTKKAKKGGRRTRKR